MGRGKLTQEFSCIQVGVLAERLVAIEIMAISRGRFVAYTPFVDDHGVDMLVFDKVSGRVLALQVKSRLRNRHRTASGGVDPCMTFDVPRVSAARARRMLVLAVVLSPDARSIQCAWLFRMREMPRVALAKRTGKKEWCMRPSCCPKSRDRYTKYRHHEFGEVVRLVGEFLEEEG